MIEPSYFHGLLEKNGTDFFSGVPDSLLKDFCAYVTDTVPENRHIIPANEGSAVALAAGHYLATGKIPLVYMQNSGIGNAVNPLLSLVDPDVYNIPLVLVIGWRGEPGVHDEPQHVKQGKVTCELLDAMGIPWVILSDDEAKLGSQVAECYRRMAETKAPYAFIVKKDTFATHKLVKARAPAGSLTREEAIERVVLASGKRDIFVSTTGKASRELYELRKKHGMGHESDFLTVGSMGHASQIALGIALERKDRLIRCLDGDGATLMHMGGMAIVGTQRPGNFQHIILNNGAHESVGAQPTVALDIDVAAVAKACGYRSVSLVSTARELDEALSSGRPGPQCIEVRVTTGSRSDLGRPATSPRENKAAFMSFIGE